MRQQMPTRRGLMGESFAKLSLMFDNAARAQMFPVLLAL